MILNTNVNQSSATSSHLPFSEKFDVNSSITSEPSTTTLVFPTFSIFAQIQSLLSILNFTSLFHSQYIGTYQNESTTPSSVVTSTSYPINATSEVLDVFSNYSFSQFAFNLSDWSPQATSDHTNLFQRIYYSGSSGNDGREIELQPHDRDQITSNDYGMITERLDNAARDGAEYGGRGEEEETTLDLNITFIEPIINATKVLDFENITIAPWKESSNNDSLSTTAVNDAVISILTAVVLAFLILLTVVGNVFVIAAILLERNLQSVANYLILSLAVTDLLVAALVMPLGAVYEVSKEWTFGPELCDMWTVSDVLCCTASILHLVAIALDRYWAVTNLDYIQQRSPKRVGTMIAVIWGVSTLISAAPLMGWKDTEWHGRVHNNICLVSQDLYYQVFATMTSFYLPLGVILILYWRIYQAARKRIRRKVGARTQSALCRGAVAISETTTFTRVSSANESPEKSSNGTINEVTSEQKNEEALRFKMAALPLNPLALLGARAPRKREMDARRERKAAKTLAVITGVFVICWLPFFVSALLMPLCPSCYFSPYIIATLLWLGYFNSTLNPIIYTIFSPDFRHAFRRILCGKKKLRKRQKEARISSIKAAKS